MIGKIYISTLGCSKNLVDSEMMVHILTEKGIRRTEQIEEADVAIVNTCGFIEAAKEESIAEILEIAEQKKKKLRYLIVAGCLSQRYHKELQADIPEVDAFVGTTSFEHIYEILKGLDEGYRRNMILDITHEVGMNSPRELLTEPYTAFLKIAEGCDNRCTYCIIPKLRGPYRSRRIEDILKEAEQLAAKGVRELILIAQDTAKYGLDLYGKRSLAELLRELNRIEGPQWIRFLYTYPEDIDEELVLAVKEAEKVCPYFDMPIQHCSDRILRRMNRGTTKAELLSKIALIRREIPEAVLRTTLITGFPGESREDFEEMKDFVEKVRFDRLGVFAYSREEDTPAAKMSEQIEEELKEERRETLMLLQQQISKESNSAFLGREMQVLIEREAEKGVYEGRSRRDAPEIDGLVFVHAKRKLQPGEFVRVKIRDFLEYDLIGDEIDEYSE